MAEFILLLRSGNYEGMDTAQMLEVVAEFGAWMRSVRDKGYEITGDELEDHGTLIKGHGDSFGVTDGPHTETKEVIGGYFKIGCEDRETVIELSKGLPHLRYGGLVEVKRVIEH